MDLLRESRSALRLLSHESPNVYGVLVDGISRAAETFGDEKVTAIHRATRSVLIERQRPEGGALSIAEASLLQQFVAFVPDVTAGMIEAVEHEHGRKRMREYLDALYLIDQAVRIGAAHDAIFDESETPGVSAPMANPRPPNPNARSSGALFKAGADHVSLPILDRELVRIRAGIYHQCRYCAGIRLLDAAGDRVVSEDMEAKLTNYEIDDLFSGAQKAMLAYADAHMADPLRIVALRDRLRANLTKRQIIDLTTEVSSKNFQKILVALRVDKPPHPARPMGFVFDSEHNVQHVKLL